MNSAKGVYSGVPERAFPAPHVQWHPSRFIYINHNIVIFYKTLQGTYLISLELSWADTVGFHW